MAMENEGKQSEASSSSWSSDSKLQLPVSCDPPGPQNPPKQLVWVIFGATGHMGRSVTKAALHHGDLVTAVGRVYENTVSSIQRCFAPACAAASAAADAAAVAGDVDGNGKDEDVDDEDEDEDEDGGDNDGNNNNNNNKQHPSPLLPLLCDVRVRETVEEVVQRSISHWGRIDVIANCSGYGVIGAAEDQDDADIRNQFEVNFWGTVNIFYASLGYFRTRREREERDEMREGETEGGAEGGGGDAVGGRYLIFSSTSGALGVPGLGPYCATKYAVEGLVESMLYELDTFNVRLTLVEPGHVRRDDDDDDDNNGGNGGQLPSADAAHFSVIKAASEPYAAPTAPAGHAKRMVQWLGEGRRHRPTSAVRSAEVVWQVAHCGFPPLRLLLGAFAVES
ncbi:MAG: hypothetical protein Q9214_006496, partial [Letrouitia sp. 1 TL-2023]